MFLSLGFTKGNFNITQGYVINVNRPIINRMSI